MNTITYKLYKVFQTFRFVIHVHVYPLWLKDFLYPILAILLVPFGCIAPKSLN